MPPRTQISPISPGPSSRPGVVLDADFDVRDGQADGAGFARAVQRVLGDDRAGFAQAVAFDEGDVELGLELLEHLGGQRRRAADAEAQGQGDVDRGVDHAAVKLGNGRQDGGLPLENLLQDVAHGVQRFDQHHRAAHQQRQQQPDGQHVAVEQRQQDGEPVGLDGLQHDAAALDVVEQVAVRKHRALGPAGGAGGVDDHGQVGLGRLRGRRLRIATADSARPRESAPSAPVRSSCSIRNSFRCGRAASSAR